jgi:hypothetical protein
MPRRAAVSWGGVERPKRGGDISPAPVSRRKTISAIWPGAVSGLQGTMPHLFSTQGRETEPGITTLDEITDNEILRIGGAPTVPHEINLEIQMGERKQSVGLYPGGNGCGIHRLIPAPVTVSPVIGTPST